MNAFELGLWVCSCMVCRDPVKDITKFKPSLKGYCKECQNKNERAWQLLLSFTLIGDSITDATYAYTYTNVGRVQGSIDYFLQNKLVASGLRPPWQARRVVNRKR